MEPSALIVEKPGAWRMKTEAAGGDAARSEHHRVDEHPMGGQGPRKTRLPAARAPF